MAGACLLALALLGFYCISFPTQAGGLGRKIAQGSMIFCGQAAYLFFALVLYRGLRLVLHRENRDPWRYVLVDGLLFVSFCGLISSAGTLLFGANYGGVIGKSLHVFLTQAFGKWGSFLTTAITFFGVLLGRAGARPANVVNWLRTQLAADWQAWRESVAQQKVQKPSVPVAPRKVIAADKPEKAKPASAPSLTPPPAIPAFSAEPPIVRVPKPIADKPTRPEPAPAPKSDAPAPEIPPYVLPSTELLTPAERNVVKTKEEDLLASAQHLEKTLLDFGIQGKVVEIHPGPIITRFDYTPAPGIKVQAVANLSNDIAMAMKAMSVRIQAPIPGKSAVGIELPNPHRAIVRLREIFESEAFQKHPSKLALGLGKDAEGHPQIADLASMPHLLIAGSTGAGKSVCIHALVMSLLYRSTPQEVKILMIDPKRVELPLYNGIPYLFDPNQNPENVRVITDVKEAAKALEGMTKVMDQRFKKLAAAMARDITHYNEKMAAEGQPPEPYIVVIIDELADMMAVAPKEVESSIQRLTQMARAVGIHIVLATQRPSVDVLTGVIKANLPARIAFRVASQTDSRVILDSMGAESLLGQGDMLFLPPGAPKPMRMQCGLVTGKDVQVTADHARAQGKPSYERVLTPINQAGAGVDDPNLRDNLDDLQQALMLVMERRRVSQDLLKAHFGSSARATDLLSQLEVKGFIMKPEGTNRWTIYFDRIDAYLGSLRSPASSAGNTNG